MNPPFDIVDIKVLTMTYIIEENYQLGGVGNVARNISSLGGEAIIISLDNADRRFEVWIRDEIQLQDWAENQDPNFGPGNRSLYRRTGDKRPIFKFSPRGL